MRTLFVLRAGAFQEAGAPLMANSLDVVEGLQRNRADDFGGALEELARALPDLSQELEFPIPPPR